MKNNPKIFEKKLMAFVGEQERTGYAPGTIENYLKSVRSWADWHDVQLRKKIKISNRNATPTLDDELVPTTEQVKEIRATASTRGRICVGAIAYAGLRPEVLGHQRIRDGLKLRYLPELDIEKLEFTKVPALVEVRPELSKAGHWYRSFIPPETCRDIISYLHRRKKRGERFTEDTPLIAVAASHRNKGHRTGEDNGHIVRAVISRDIRKAMRPTYTFRPYVLRHFFSTRLLMAVSDGVVDNNFRIYWMGQKGHISARYSSNKALLPDDLIENMRAAYKRSMPYLVGSTLDENELRKKMFLDIFPFLGRRAGFREEEIEEIKNKLRQTESVDKAIEEINSWGMVVMQNGESQKQLARDLKVPQGSGDRFYVVNGDERLLEYVKRGWSLVREIEPEKKADVADETWRVGDEEVSASNKIAAFIGDNGTIEVRGNPDEIDDIFKQMEKLGVHMQDVKKRPPRYLLKKNLHEG